MQAVPLGNGIRLSFSDSDGGFPVDGGVILSAALLFISFIPFQVQMNKRKARKTQPSSRCNPNKVGRAGERKGEWFSVQ